MLLACQVKAADALFERALEANFGRLATFLLKKDGDSGEEDDDEEDAAAKASVASSKRRSGAAAENAILGRGGALPPELREVRDLLREQCDTVSASFDFYAAMGGGDGGGRQGGDGAAAAASVTFLGMNGYTRFLQDGNLIVADSKHCALAHLDRLFIEARRGIPNLAP